MFKRLLAVVLIISTILCLFCACEEDEEINVFYPVTADPECVDPQIAENDVSKLIVSNCMEGLVRLGPDGKIYPAGAKSWDISQDGLVYTFELDNKNWQMLKTHKNVLGEDYEKTFSTKVVAADFAFGIERALRPETKAEDAYLLYPVKNAEKFNKGEAGRADLGVKAVNDSTLVITLDRPYPDLLRVLTDPMCMPCDEYFFNATGAKYGLELKYTLCNGPFYMGRWNDGGSVILYRNESYVSADDRFKTNAIYFYVNDSESQFITKFKQGDYNSMSVSDEFLPLVKASDETNTITQCNKTYGFVFNCEDSFLSDENLRKALVSSLDSSTMTVDGINLKTAEGVIPDSCRWGEASYRAKSGKLNLNSYNPGKASEYFKKSVEDNEIKNVNISIICTENFKKPIIRMIQKWEKIFGLAITVSVDSIEQKDLDTAVKNGEYQIAFTCVEAKDGNVLSCLKYFTSDSIKNYSNYFNEDYDLLIKENIIDASGDNIADLCKSAEQKLVDDGVFYPVFCDNSYSYLNEELKNAFVLPGTERFDFACWNSDRWENGE